MKFTATLLLCCSFLCFTTVNAQFEYDLEELLERHSQTYMGNLNDVFTQDELQVLQAHFNEVNDINTFSTSSILDNRIGETTRSNSPTRSYQLVPDPVGVIDWGPSSLDEFEGAGTVVIDENASWTSLIVDNDNGLHLRDLASNDYTKIGDLDIDPIPNGAVTGLETMSNGDVYGIYTNGVDDSRLIKINTSTWAAEFIGNNNGLMVPINLVRDGDDELYTLDIEIDGVFRLNITTGEATMVGMAGFDANFGQGGSFDPVANKVLFAAYNADIGDSELRELDTTTGFTISLGIITPGDQDQFGWVGMYDEDTAGVNSNSFEGFSYYPNPVENELSLSAQNTIDRVTVYNVLGQEIINRDIQQLQGILNLENLLSGYYLLKVEIDGETETFKLIKR